jgi:hypothetical protein
VTRSVKGSTPRLAPRSTATRPWDFLRGRGAHERDVRKAAGVGKCRTTHGFLSEGLISPSSPEGGGAKWAVLTWCCGTPDERPLSRRRSKLPRGNDRDGPARARSRRPGKEGGEEDPRPRLSSARCRAAEAPSGRRDATSPERDPYVRDDMDRRAWLRDPERRRRSAQHAGGHARIPAPAHLLIDLPVGSTRHPRSPASPITRRRRICLLTRPPRTAPGCAPSMPLPRGARGARPA